MAVALAERCLGLEVFGVDEALDNNLSLGRDQKVDGFCLHDVERSADQSAGNGKLVGTFWQFQGRGERHTRWSTEHHRGRHRLAACLIF